RILPLADGVILPQAKQESYFFNRIGRKLPLISRPTGVALLVGAHGLQLKQGYGFGRIKSARTALPSASNKRTLRSRNSGD
ncbi:hypothetical protein, partial [Pseudomonas syringae]|uniref:hypothetical protein n=1 Tax=Pseudomonas syringae TaxID=317 RepID=UPI001A7E0F52